MSPQSRHLFKKALGLLFVSVGFAALIGDLHVAYLTQSAAHLTNLIVSGALIFCGGLMLDPPSTESIADAVVSRLPMFWPGGRRAGDPPPDPRIPPPPSVTGEHAP